MEKQIEICLMRTINTNSLEVVNPHNQYEVIRGRQTQCHAVCLKEIIEPSWLYLTLRYLQSRSQKSIS